jgi:hypothetical protein
MQGPASVLEKPNETLRPPSEHAVYVGVAAVPGAAEVNMFGEDPIAAGFRHTLRATPPRIQGTFNAYLGHTFQSLFDQQSTSGKPNDEPWGPWLATYGTPDQLRQMSASHAQNVAAANRDQVLRQIADSRRDWLVDRVGDAMRQGWFSPHASRAMHRLEGTTITFGDPLTDKTLHDARGYWKPGSTQVVLNQPLSAPPRERRRLLTAFLGSSTPLHEMFHSGFTERKDGMVFPSWFEEAGTEDAVQLVLALADGQDPGFLYPSRHSASDLKRSYTPGRRVRYAMLTYGSKQVSAKKYMRAWSSPGIGSKEMADWEDDLDDSWGTPDVFDQVTRRITEVEAMIRLRHEGRPTYINRDEAAYQVADELERSPWLVFGAGYKHPRAKTAGHGVLTGARR